MDFPLFKSSKINRAATPVCPAAVRGPPGCWEPNWEHWEHPDAQSQAAGQESHKAALKPHGVIEGFPWAPTTPGHPMHLHYLLIQGLLVPREAPDQQGWVPEA